MCKQFKIRMIHNRQYKIIQKMIIKIRIMIINMITTIIMM